MNLGAVVHDEQPPRGSRRERKPHSACAKVIHILDDLHEPVLRLDI